MRPPTLQPQAGGHGVRRPPHPHFYAGAPAGAPAGAEALLMFSVISSQSAIIFWNSSNDMLRDARGEA